MLGSDEVSFCFLILISDPVTKGAFSSYLAFSLFTDSDSIDIEFECRSSSDSYLGEFSLMMVSSCKSLIEKCYVYFYTFLTYSSRLGSGGSGDYKSP